MVKTPSTINLSVDCLLFTTSFPEPLSLSWPARSATDRISGVFDETFDELASNASQAIYPPPTKTRDDEITVRQLSSDDPFLFPPHLRFGRIDYMGKTDVILTKWLIFK